MYGSKYQMWRIPRYAGPKSNNLKKLNGHSFLRNPRYHWLSGHCKKFLVLFAQNSIGNCLIVLFQQLFCAFAVIGIITVRCLFQ